MKKSGLSLLRGRCPGSLIRSGYFYPDAQGSIPGGLTALAPGPRTQAGVSDYFCVSESLEERLVDAKILTDVMGSDHCPIVLEIK